MGEGKTIDVIIRELVKSKINRNGQCTLTVQKIAREAAREMGILEKYGRLDKDVYLTAERVLQELGGVLWSKSQRKFSQRHVYGFNVEKEHPQTGSETMNSHPSVTESEEEWHDIIFALLGELPATLRQDTLSACADDLEQLVLIREEVNHCIDEAKTILGKGGME